VSRRAPDSRQRGDVSIWRSVAIAAAIGLSLGPWVPDVRAQDAGTSSPDPDPAVAVRLSLKGSGLFARLPDDPDLSSTDGGSGFWRARVEPKIRLGQTTWFEFAYEHQIRTSTWPSGASLFSVLPPTSPAPFRIRQLDWEIAATPHASWRHEIDRAALRARTGAVEMTIGRQAIGWGRGLMFGAIDLFSPFTPLEADREWRRGVDAVHVDLKLSDRTSVDLVGAFGRTWDSSATGARVRGYAGRLDLEAVGGWRARDRFAGVASSAAVGGAELHAEVAVFATPGVPGSTAFGVDRMIVKVVAGGSYRLPIGHGVFANAEYHYSGFGAAAVGDIPDLLADPVFQVRYLRGDTQILERHAVAGLANYEVSPLTSVALQWIHNPLDGSGVGIPSVAFTFSDRWSMTMNGYLPYGPRPVGGVPRSEYGVAPVAVFLQVRLYL
jgi:hypothetical protein